MLGDKLLVVATLGMPAHQTLHLVRSSLKSHFAMLRVSKSIPWFGTDECVSHRTVHMVSVRTNT